MKESYGKGLANSPDPESCVAGREAAIEALTGAQAGRAIERRNHGLPSADDVLIFGRQHSPHRSGKAW